VPEITQLLQQIEQGNPQAAGELLPVVYEELRQLASRKLSQEQPGQTLQATALVHEAYLRLVKPGDAPAWSGRRHFFAAAAEAMRRILVESARRKRRLKRGGELVRTEFDEQLALAPEVQEDLVALDEALTRLAATDKVAAELVELRYFAGLTIAEAAEQLDLAPRTADRTWAYARAWLHREIQVLAGADDNS
jgi:RNA polymerase sigma factor (TIGR02999 family)